jgi:hypothetical protein
MPRRLINMLTWDVFFDILAVFGHTAAALHAASTPSPVLDDRDCCATA